MQTSDLALRLVESNKLLALNRYYMGPLFQQIYLSDIAAYYRFFGLFYCLCYCILIANLLSKHKYENKNQKWRKKMEYFTFTCSTIVCSSGQSIIVSFRVSFDQLLWFLCWLVGRPDDPLSHRAIETCAKRDCLCQGCRLWVLESTYCMNALAH